MIAEFYKRCVAFGKNVENIRDEYLILKENDYSYLYNSKVAVVYKAHDLQYIGDDYLRVKNNNEYGVYDLSTELMLFTGYKKVKYATHDLFSVSENGNFYTLVNKQDEQVMQPQGDILFINSFVYILRTIKGLLAFYLFDLGICKQIKCTSLTVVECCAYVESVSGKVYCITKDGVHACEEDSVDLKYETSDTLRASLKINNEIIFENQRVDKIWSTTAGIVYEE